MIKVVFLLISALLGMFSTSKAQLTPLFREPHDVQRDHSTFGHLNIVANADGSILSNKGDLLFKPDLREERYLFEIWDKRILIITELVEGAEIFPMVYHMPKHKLIIVDLSNDFRKYKVNLPGCFLDDINLDKLQIMCKVEAGQIMTFEIEIAD